MQRQRHAGAWFPHALLDALLAQLRAAGTPLDDLRAQLAAALEAHSGSALQQSALLEQRMAGGS